jgi:hypothetical protein
VALAPVLRVSKACRRIRALLKSRGCRFIFAAPSAGRLAVHWYGAGKRRRTLIASAAARAQRKQKLTVALRLSARGRTLLGQVRRLKLTVEVSFTPRGPEKISEHRTVVL